MKTPTLSELNAAVDAARAAYHADRTETNLATLNAARAAARNPTGTLTHTLGYVALGLAERGF